MAETYSVEYARSFTATPPGNNYAFGSALRTFDFTYVQAATGTIADTILLVQLPILATLDMLRSWLEWSGFAGSTTLSIGWEAYTNVNGVAVAASAAGLLSALPINADGEWVGGTIVLPTSDDHPPVVARKVFHNREPLNLYATVAGAGAAADAVFNGSFGVKTP